MPFLILIFHSMLKMKKVLLLKPHFLCMTDLILNSFSIEKYKKFLQILSSL